MRGNSRLKSGFEISSKLESKIWWFDLVLVSVSLHPPELGPHDRPNSPKGPNALFHSVLTIDYDN